jgi:ABC-type sugar transport system ATPase subunit
MEIDCNGMVLSPVLNEALPASGRVVIGIRPEDVYLSTQPTAGAREVDVAFTETAGPFTWVVFRWRDVELRGVSDANEELKAGSTAFMRFSSGQVAVFDAGTGKRL